MWGISERLYSELDQWKGKEKEEHKQRLFSQAGDSKIGVM